jgi:hypothetical protein
MLTPPKIAFSFLSIGLLIAGPQDTPGTVQGSVIHAGTMEGIARVRVEVCPPKQEIASLLPDRSQIGVIRIGNGAVEVLDKEGATILATTECPMPITTVTDESGRFTVRDLKPGNYLLKATRNGYTQTTRARNPETVTASFTIGPNSLLIDVGSLRMVRAGTISGIFLDNQGRTIPGAAVAAVIPDALNRARYAPVQVAQTNDRGEYRLVGLPAGEYFVFASLPNPTPGTAEFAGRNVFYPGVSQLTDATPIVVVEGENVSAMNIAWRPR